MCSRSLSVWYTNSSRRREFVYQIKIGCECFIVLKKRPILWVHWRSNFKNKHCLRQAEKIKHWLNIHFFCIFLMNSALMSFSKTYKRYKTYIDLKTYIEISWLLCVIVTKYNWLVRSYSRPSNATIWLTCKP